MASNEIEIVDPAASVDQLNKIAAGRALNRRRFLAALGMSGAAAGVGLMSGCTTTSNPPVVIPGSGQATVLNFILNLHYLEATMYSYVTTGADINMTTPIGSGVSLAGSGAITGHPAMVTFTGANASQMTDMVNEICFDEVGHVAALQNLLGTSAIPRPAINLAAFGAVSASNALSLLRLLEDIGVSAHTNAITTLSTSNATYAGQILGTESFHSGGLRLTSIQNPSIAAYIAPADGLGVPPVDLGNPTAEAAGPTASGGFFPTYGAAQLQTTAGAAFSRTTSQVLALLYGSVTTVAASGTSSGGFFPSGVNGSINTV